jgi:hypothetical protein
VKQQLKNISVQVDEVLSGDLTASSIVVETAGWEISEAPGEGEKEAVARGEVKPKSPNTP